MRNHEQNKNLVWKLIGLFITASLFMMGCWCETTPIEECGLLQAANRDTGFILQLYPWEDFPDPYRNPCEYKFMVFELETYFFNLPPGSIDTVKVRRECNCDFVLVDVLFNEGMGLDTSATASASNPREQSDGSGGILAAVDRNYRLNFGPHEGMPPLPITPIYHSKHPDIGPLRPIPIGPGSSEDPMIIAAIIDSGIDYLHEGIAQQTVNGVSGSVMWYNAMEVQPENSYLNSTSFNGVDEDEENNCLVDDAIGYDYFAIDSLPLDKNGHGTHVAGVVATATASAYPGVRPSLMALQIGGYEYTEEDTVFTVDLFAALCALEYAIKNKADVINMSWGFYSDNSNIHLDAMIARAAADSIIMVTSAGNDNVDIDVCTHWPSNYSIEYPNLVISVGALDEIPSDINPGDEPFEKASYSNFGDNLDIYAPGTQINGAMAGSGNDYFKLNGTSMAAPVVSRDIVIELAQGTPPMEVKQRILTLKSKKMNNGCLTSVGFDYILDSSLDEIIR